MARTLLDELDLGMQRWVRDTVHGWEGDDTRLIDEVLAPALPTTWDRTKVEHLVAEVRTVR